MWHCAMHCAMQMSLSGSLNKLVPLGAPKLTADRAVHRNSVREA